MKIHGEERPRTLFPHTSSECEERPSGKLTINKAMAILEAQGHKCALTGLPMTPKNASLDHVTPLSRGGEHDASNCQWIFDFVNTAKGSMTQEEFIEMCRAVARTHP